MDACLADNGLFYCISITHPVVFVALAAAIVAVFGIAFQRKTAREKNSIDFEESYKKNTNIKNAMLEIYSLNESKVRALIKDDGSVDDNDKSVIAIRRVLNEWERAATAISHQVYDNQYLYQIYGTTVLNLFDVLHPFITARQNKNSRLYINFQLLAVDWIIKRKRDEGYNYPKQLKEAQQHIHYYCDHKNAKGSLIELRKGYDKLKEVMDSMYDKR
ncbi:DUF4760 domain-containing protein [Aliikangiella coralliicola]|uniref:DUF4760 domain-containing protein n=1 Tax=Aliikangiella coralliicola TaxID=2592383 RepID=A0A545UCT4_9GAMM|nr:DUF4760 domain-containing protein [Aliikangiella coralliicola]TQV87275.1 DUF4760 domain-containing protein [Aliikangiella coralliicola]